MVKSFARGRCGRVVVSCSLAVVGLGMFAGRHDARPAAMDAVSLGVTEAFAAPVRGMRDATSPARETERVLALLDSLRGRSGKLRARLLPRSSGRLTYLTGLLGDTTMRAVGVHDVADSTGARAFTLITIRDFADKLDGRIGAYRIGFWPAERGRALNGAYATPPASSRSRRRTRTRPCPSTSGCATSSRTTSRGCGPSTSSSARTWWTSSSW